MKYLFWKYYLEVCAVKHSNEPNAIGEITDKYYLDKKGRLSKDPIMKENAEVFGIFKGRKKVKEIIKNGYGDKSKWVVALVPVHEADFINYVQTGEE